MIEDCPLCGSKLEKGFITGYQITWSKRRGEVPFTRRRFACYEAYRCSKCDFVLFNSRPLPRERLLDTVPTFDMSYILKEKEEARRNELPRKRRKTLIRE